MILGLSMVVCYELGLQNTALYHDLGCVGKEIGNTREEKPFLISTLFLDNDESGRVSSSHPSDCFVCLAMLIKCTKSELYKREIETMDFEFNLAE